MKKRMIRIAALLLAGAILTTSANYADMNIAKENARITVSDSYYKDFSSVLENSTYQMLSACSIPIDSDGISTQAESAKETALNSMNDLGLSDENLKLYQQAASDYMKNYQFSDNDFKATASFDEASKAKISKQINSFMEDSLRGVKFETNDDATITASVGDSRWSQMERNIITDTLKDSTYTGKISVCAGSKFANGLQKALEKTGDSDKTDNDNISTETLASVIANSLNDSLSNSNGNFTVSSDQWDRIAEGSISAAKETIQTACSDLSSQMEEYTQKISYCNDSISSYENQIADLKAEDILDSESQDTEDQINNLENQIKELKEKKESYEKTSKDLLSCTGFSTIKDLKSYQKDNTDVIASELNTITQKKKDLITNIDTEIAKLREEGQDTAAAEQVKTQIQSATNDFVKNINTSCETFANTDVGKADLTSYLSDEKEALSEISTKLEENKIFSGSYETENNNDTEETSDESTNFSPETDLPELKHSLSEIQESLDSFQKQYGNALSNVADSVNAVSTTLNMMANGGIYNAYTKELSAIVSETAKNAEKLRTEESSDCDRLNDFSDSIKDMITTYQTDTDGSLKIIQNSINNASDQIQSNVMNMSDFTQYQGYVAKRLATANDSVAALQKNIETEAAERKVMDEKLSMAIGAVRSDLMYLIGSTSISNVGASITEAIGNTSLAGITYPDGTEANGSLSDSIAALNSNIANIANTDSAKHNIYDNSIAGGNNRIADHLNGGGQAYLNIKYTENFKNIPTVVATINHSYTDILKVSVYNCTKKGCTIQVKNTGTVKADNINVNWIAFDYLAY